MFVFIIPFQGKILFMKITKVLFFILLPLFKDPAFSFEADSASKKIHSLLSISDTLYKRISNNNLFRGKPSSIDSLFTYAIKTHPEIYALVYVNTNGSMVSDINRDLISNTLGSVRKKDWFVIPSSTDSPYVAGIVSANSKLCLLKTYPISDSTKIGVLAILVELQECLKDLKTSFPFPFLLLYNNTIIYQSDLQLPYSRIPIPSYKNMEFIYSENSVLQTETMQEESLNISVFEKCIRILATTLPWSLTSIAVIFSFFFFFSRKNKVTREELVALEYQKLPEQVHKLIHDRAISQLYCEIKRQLETHEIDNIRNEVREKLVNEMKVKIMNMR